MFEGSNLLATLREETLALLQPRMSECELEAGHVFFEPGDVVTECYFPRNDAVASFFVTLENNVSVETVMVGREGALGGIVSQGAMPAYSRSAVVQNGSFYRIASADLEAAKEQSSDIRFLFARYADCLMAQVFQSVACNAMHTIEQRAAKWLCSAVERTGASTISMTQEQLASMMGIGRSYASRVIQRFKRDGLVLTRRGGLDVLDPEGLQRRACSCNLLVKQHFDTVLRGVYPD